MATARQAAFLLLKKMQKDAAYSNLLLENASLLGSLSRRDRALATALVYGVIERRLTLDYQLSQYLSKPLSKLSPEAVCVLRLGVYQLLFLEKIPSSAAINESVKLAKKYCAYASGLCNAVLRKVSQQGLVLPQETAEDYLSVKYSCPQWLIDQWTRDYGEETARGILAHSFAAQGFTVRVNTNKTGAQALLRRLEEEGVTAETTDQSGLLKLLNLPCRVDELPSFKDGLFHVQDKASMLCALSLDAKKGERVFDLCAAPGGKTFTVAEEMENSGEVLAFDLYAHRTALIESGAKRLGLSCVKAAQGDASAFDAALGQADRVLCDVPCSGLGILRQKPEVKWKDPATLQNLPALQLKILSTGAQYVKNGGRLIYSTCALSRAENEDVCAAFLKDHPAFQPVPALPALSEKAFLTLFPQQHDCDGFFIAAFRKDETA